MLLHKQAQHIVYGCAAAFRNTGGEVAHSPGKDIGIALAYCDKIHQHLRVNTVHCVFHAEDLLARFVINYTKIILAVLAPKHVRTVEHSCDVHRFSVIKLYLQRGNGDAFVIERRSHLCGKIGKSGSLCVFAYLLLKQHGAVFSRLEL